MPTMITADQISDLLIDDTVRRFGQLLPRPPGLQTARRNAYRRDRMFDNYRNARDLMAHAGAAAVVPVLQVNRISTRNQRCADC